MKLIKIAAPKDKILQYGIKDPFIKFLVFQNENLIPWNQMPTAKDFKKQNQQPQADVLINQFISQSLLPSLYSKIDINSEKPEETHYLKDINLEQEFQNNINDPQVQQAYSIYKTDPEEAKARILENINEEKQDTFAQWWDYIVDQYKEYPAFAYLMLKPVIDSSNASKHTPPPPLNANAVAAVFDKIKDGSQGINTLKEFTTEVAKTSNVVEGTFSDGWIHIPSQKLSESNPQKYGEWEENLKRLRTYGQAGQWCVGQDSWSRRYLSQGSFYIYTTDGKPRVAIRTEGDRSVAEIRGKSNNSENLYPYWEDVENFLKGTNLSYKDNYQYKEIEEIAKLNKSVTADPQKGIAYITSEIEKDPSVYNKLSKQNREIPQIKSFTIEKWKRFILSSPEDYSNMPPDLKEEISQIVFPQVLKYYIDTYKKEEDKGVRNHDWRYRYMPDEVKASLPKEIIEDVKQKWISDINSDIKQSSRCPIEILEDPEVKAITTEKWLQKAQDKPWIIKDCPETIKDNFPQEFIEQFKNNVITQLITELNDINNNPKQYNPEEIVDMYQETFEQEIENTEYDDDGYDKDGFNEEGYNREETYNKSKDRSALKTNNLRDINEVMQTLKQAWCTYLEADIEARYQELENIDNDYYRENDSDHPRYSDRVYEAVNNAWDDLVNTDPKKYDDLPYGMDDRYIPEYNGENTLARIWGYYLPSHLEDLPYIQDFAIVDIDANVLANALSSYLQSNSIPYNIYHYFKKAEEIPFENVFTVFNVLSPEEKQEVIDRNPNLINHLEYAKQRNKDKLLLEQGQQEFPFVDKKNQDSEDLEQAASKRSWYKKAKFLESFIR